MTDHSTPTPAPRIALVTDSTAEPPPHSTGKYQAAVIPLHFSLGDVSYIDGVDLDTAEFYRLFRGVGEVARSSQPSVGEFASLYSTLLEEYDAVLSVHISGRLSGTAQTAEVAAETIAPELIHVVDSRHVSVGLGLVVRAAARTIQAGHTIDEVLAATREASLNTRVYGSVPGLEVAVRGGRVSQRAARLLDMLDLKPIIAFDAEGAARVDGGRLGFDRALRSLAHRVARFAGAGAAEIAIAHADNEKAGLYLRDLIARTMGEQEIPVTQAGPVITSHVGLGAVAIGVRRLSHPISPSQEGSAT